ncbi:MAG: type II toxin-antitoxin system PemK/MazF family toxin [Flavobacteriales bacterium]|nr:type II toxin-antitoxin system PemK/MazF family toxin [Flavobacteriales bacterium]
MVCQRDIVEVVFDDDFGGNHPAIVLSNKLVQDVEGYFVCVMMTSKNFNDEFSFVINDEMLTKPLNREHCEARCHLINFVPVDSIIRNRYRNQIKIDSFKKLIDKINKSTFSTKDL